MATGLIFTGGGKSIVIKQLVVCTFSLKVFLPLLLVISNLSLACNISVVFRCFRFDPREKREEDVGKEKAEAWAQ